MIKKYNPATESESEVLNLIQEECSEVIQIISKIHRFGFDSYHPTDLEKESNRSRLESEIGDLLALIQIACDRGIVHFPNVWSAIESKKERLKTFSNVYSNDSKQKSITKSEHAELQELRKFIRTAFEAHPNLDIDVEKIYTRKDKR